MAVFNILKGCYILDTLEDIARSVKFSVHFKHHKILCSSPFVEG